MQMKIDKILLGERRRYNSGDIASLAADIRAHGLLHPIVVTASGELVCGGRRLAAHQQLGKTWIEVTQLGDLSEDEIHEMELSENIERLDLTPDERSRIMIAKVQRAKVEAIAESAMRSNMEQNSPRRRGQPSKPASVRDVGKRTNTPQTTVQRIEAYAAAIGAYPVLDGWPKAPAIEAAKVLATMPGDRRDEVLGQLSQSRMTGKPGLDFVRASARGRLTSLNPGAGVPAFPVSPASEGVNDRRNERLVEVLRQAHHAVLMAARAFDDGRGERLREMAREIGAMRTSLDETEASV